MRPVGTALLLILASSCSSPFAPYSHIGALSVIAIHAEPPEVGPNQTTTLTATAFDPMGRPIVIDWAACTLPPDSSGAEIPPACFTTASGDGILPIGEGDSVSFTMPDLHLDPKTAFLQHRFDATDGVYLPIRLVVKAGDSTLQAAYGLRYSVLPMPPNRNPIITDIVIAGDADGGAPDASLTDGLAWDRSSPLTMRAILSPDSAEQYMVVSLDSNGNPVATQKTEVLRVAWFATEGAFDNEVTGLDRPDTTLTFDATTPAGPLDVWTVVNDGRGGNAVVHRTLQLR